MIAQTFHNRTGAGVAHGKPLTGLATEVGFATGCPVQGHVADNDVVGGDEGRSAGRIHHDAPTGEPFANVVVGIAFQFERDTGREKCAKTLTS